MKEKKTENSNKLQHYKRAVIGLSIATGILSATTLGLGIAYGVTQNQASNYSLQLENIYKKNYFELVDEVNNADMKVSKLLASSSDTYQAKMLSEVAQSAKNMQSNIASLPLYSDNVLESVRFINQMSGYTQILQEKIARGGSLSSEDIQTLNEMHESLTEMKRYLNRMSTKMIYGYSIMEASKRMDGDYDEFSLDFAGIKAIGTDYPTMIYDGPFSDSVVNSQIKGLKGELVTKEDVYSKIDKLFKNVSNIKFEDETDGKFSTYNFQMQNSDGQNLYVQATKVGGNILTVSGNADADEKKIELDQAKEIALNFAKENGIENAKIVWHQELDGEAYFNIAPTESGIVLYPDLVKVKVDLMRAQVIGYDAINYFTNHTARNLVKPTVDVENLKAKIDKSFTVEGTRIVLAPLEYNREVVCEEIKCTRDGATYYIYFNAVSGEEENVLKVVETTDGAKLM